MDISGGGGEITPKIWSKNGVFLAKFGQCTGVLWVPGASNMALKAIKSKFST